MAATGTRKPTKSRSRVSTKHVDSSSGNDRNTSHTWLVVSSLLLLIVIMWYPDVLSLGNWTLPGNQTLRSDPGMKTSLPNKDLQRQYATEAPKFQPSYQYNLKMKKVFFDGRRIAPVELSPKKNLSQHHSVRVYLVDDFLSEFECDSLRSVHNRHVGQLNQTPAITCYEDVDTLRQNLISVGKGDVHLTNSDFVSGTNCLNESLSAEVGDWLNRNWSYSTAFYHSESVFSMKLASLIQEVTSLKNENGGKFQLTSYPTGVGYRRHTDCTEDDNKRDRMATVLVYLDDVAEGGETTFPELGIHVKPKKGQALIWNNMNTAGTCEQVSVHQANMVTDGHKYILQRWYYHESFYSLGTRPTPPPLPDGLGAQAMVLCDEYSHGSCRWYDEWSYDTLNDYRHMKHGLRL